MLGNINAMATIAVKDLAKSRKFYEEILQLKKGEFDGPDVGTYKSGDSTIVIYESPYAGTNQATTVTWGVGNQLESIVQGLKNAGVVFEHYDLPGGRRDGDIHIFGDFRAAWFKDPDGNILHINSD